ncbi:sister chromatid cohesion protein 1 [Saitoella coloradoensis]
MFYAESLLTRKGPLARIWLAAHMERRLTKPQITTTNIPSSVSSLISDTDSTAPMALRLSGQLLLGVVRIYSRKARYLLEDAQEAMGRIKMAFRPGNVDLNLSTQAEAHTTLTLPDVITELDLLMPTADLSFLDGTVTANLGANTSRAADITLREEDISIEYGLNAPDTSHLLLGENPMELGSLDPQTQMELDLGLDFSTAAAGAPKDTSISVEIGRDAPTIISREVSLEPAGEKTTLEFGAEEQPALAFDDDLGIGADIEIPGLDFGELTTRPQEEAEGERTPRAGSPLLEEGERTPRAAEAEEEFRLATPIVEEQEQAEEARHAAPRRQLKVQIDAKTELTQAQLKAHLRDPSSTLLPPDATTLLPRDPVMLSLVLGQQGGWSVWRQQGVHPDLAGLLSPDFVRGMKRRREEGEAVQPEEEEEPARKEARLDEPGIEPMEDVQMEEAAPLEDEPQALAPGEEEELGFGAEEPQVLEFDEPVLGAEDPYQPAETTGLFEDEPNLGEAALPEATQPGVVSRNTVKAIQYLRSEFRPEAEAEAKEVVDFEQMTTGQSRADAVKMFFEVLVLATKDVVKVKQDEAYGGIEIRAKERLFEVGVQGLGEEESEEAILA